jgi:hypothetical protein
MKNQSTIIAQETYNYNGLTIKRIDSIVDSQFSTTTALAKRDWFVEDKIAHTFKIEDKVYLCFYEIPASKGGERKVLKNFTPDVNFHIEQTQELSNMISEMTGKSVLVQHCEDNF